MISPNFCFLRILEIVPGLEGGGGVLDSSGGKKIKLSILGNWAMVQSRQVFSQTGNWASLGSGFFQGLTQPFLVRIWASPRSQN